MDWKEALSKLDMPQDDSAAGQPEEQTAEQLAQPAEERQEFSRIKVQVEKKGRKGKTATILYGFTCSDTELQRIASQLKAALGCGGSARDGEILLQGEVREKALSALRKVLG